jgi:hypothetical protein
MIIKNHKKPKEIVKDMPITAISETDSFLSGKATPTFNIYTNDNKITLSLSECRRIAMKLSRFIDAYNTEYDN